MNLLNTHKWNSGAEENLLLTYTFCKKVFSNSYINNIRRSFTFLLPLQFITLRVSITLVIFLIIVDIEHPFEHMSVCHLLQLKILLSVNNITKQLVRSAPQNFVNISTELSLDSGMHTKLRTFSLIVEYK